MRPTFAEQDRLAAARATKCRELVFCRSYNYGQIFNESYEVARNQLEAKK
jgi:hypothetical protein